MASDEGRTRALERAAKLAGCADDLVAFWRASTEVLRGSLPHYWTPCWYTIDPASLLITSHFNEDMAEFPAAWLEHEYYADDVNQVAAVARSTTGVSTLHDATGGDPSGSPRWQQNMTMGGDQELILALRTPRGEAWGALGLYREPGQPLFNEEDKRFARALAPYLAAGARRSLLIGEASEPDSGAAPGLVVLDERLRLRSITASGERWLREIPDSGMDAGRLPSCLLAVAVEALRSGEAVSRVRSRSGAWLALHGERLYAPAGTEVTLILGPAGPARIFPLLASAYGLTRREIDVTQLVLKGGSTAEIADGLSISRHTVQQHLKRIFDKTGVRSRRDLAGKLFFAHYEPRLRDNERRAAEALPLRGGPFEPRT